MPHQVHKGKGVLAGHSKTKNLVNKASLYVKNKWQSDKNPVQAHLNKQAGIANTKTASGRIQKKLTDAGHSQTSLRHKKEEHSRFQKNRADMQKLRKTNPERYKKLKKEQRKKEREAAFAKRGNSSSWD